VTRPGASGPVTEVAAGGLRSLAATATGQLFAFGSNLYGRRLTLFVPSQRVRNGIARSTHTVTVRSHERRGRIAAKILEVIFSLGTGRAAIVGGRHGDAPSWPSFTSGTAGAASDTGSPPAPSARIRRGASSRRFRSQPAPRSPASGTAFTPVWR